jgi:hypothetical protein
VRISRKVCFIAGAGHSGSTLLGLILGSHSQGFYAGECRKTRYLHKAQAPLRKRSCKFCGLDCPVWGDIEFTDDADLYEQIAQQVQRKLQRQASLVIDSTKNASWIREQWACLAPTTAQPYLIFLQRDGRAVVNSRRRKYPDRPLETIIENWVSQLQTTQQLFADCPYAKLAVHYEAIASDPQTEIARICQFLQIDYEPNMLNFASQAHHVLGGNNGTQFLATRAEMNSAKLFQDRLSIANRAYYHHQAPKITLDLRWRQEFSAENQALFESLAGHFNRPLEWNP